jgi:hypothetical protein
MRAGTQDFQNHAWPASFAPASRQAAMDARKQVEHISFYTAVLLCTPAVISAGLTYVMFHRYQRTQKVMPAGMVVGLR